MSVYEHLSRINNFTLIDCTISVTLSLPVLNAKPDLSLIRLLNNEMSHDVCDFF